jgi:hypothetical protein
LDSYLVIQWSSEQISGKLIVSHESVYLNAYENKAELAAGGDLPRPSVAKSLGAAVTFKSVREAGKYLNAAQRPSNIEDGM